MEQQQQQQQQLPTVREQRNEILAMFPELDLEAYLDARWNAPADVIVNHLLENYDQMPKKKQRKPKQEEDEDDDWDWDADDEDDQEQEAGIAEPEEVFNAIVNFADADVSRFLQRLADHTEDVLTPNRAEEKRQRRTIVDLSGEQKAELTDYLVAKFNQIRIPTIKALMAKGFSMDELLVVLFFFDNNATRLATFQQVANSVGMEFFHHFEPLYKPRWVTHHRIADAALRAIVNKAVAGFEKVAFRLMRMAQGPEHHAFGPIRFMGSSIRTRFLRKQQKENEQRQPPEND